MLFVVTLMLQLREMCACTLRAFDDKFNTRTPPYQPSGQLRPRNQSARYSVLRAALLIVSMPSERLSAICCVISFIDARLATMQTQRPLEQGRLSPSTSTVNSRSLLVTLLLQSLTLNTTILPAPVSVVHFCACSSMIYFKLGGERKIFPKNDVVSQCLLPQVP